MSHFLARGFIDWYVANLNKPGVELPPSFLLVEVSPDLVTGIPFMDYGRMEKDDGTSAVVTLGINNVSDLIPLSLVLQKVQKDTDSILRVTTVSECYYYYKKLPPTMSLVDVDAAEAVCDIGVSLEEAFAAKDPRVSENFTWVTVARDGAYSFGMLPFTRSDSGLVLGEETSHSGNVGGRIIKILSTVFSGSNAVH